MTPTGSIRQQYNGMKYLLNDVGAVHHDGGVVSVGAQGNMENRAALCVVDLLSRKHGEDLKEKETTKRAKTRIHKTMYVRQ